MTGMHSAGVPSTATPDRDSIPALNSGLARIAIVIPAWQPDHRLRELVNELRLRGLLHLVLVDDGSTPDRQPLFLELAAIDGVELRRHPTNQGKGCALKTAFAHLLSHSARVSGVVTADADGQHLPDDIVRVAQHLLRKPDRTVLGVRSFAGRVPLRSRFGNGLTRRIFSMLTGHAVTDTQTGLRGIPLALLPELATLPGNRYEYEIVMLAHLCQARGTPEQLPIQTVYLDGNRASHFNPLWDSLRIYRALLRVSKPWKRSTAQRSEATDKPRLRPA